MKTIINCKTGKIVERSLNEEELLQFNLDAEANAVKQAAIAAQATAKAAILARLGITADEAKLLLA